MSNVIPTNFGELTIYRGTKRILEFHVVDENGDDIDLTGYVLTFRMRESEYASDPYFTADCDIPTQLGDDVGVARATIDRATSLLWHAKTYPASLFRNLPGDEDLFAIGTVRVRNTIYDKGLNDRG
jgi:hypothetical protein